MLAETITSESTHSFFYAEDEKERTFFKYIGFLYTISIHVDMEPLPRLRRLAKAKKSPEVQVVSLLFPGHIMAAFV